LGASQRFLGRPCLPKFRNQSLTGLLLCIPGTRQRCVHVLLLAHRMHILLRDKADGIYKKKKDMHLLHTTRHTRAIVNFGLICCKKGRMDGAWANNWIEEFEHHAFTPS